MKLEAKLIGITLIFPFMSSQCTAVWLFFGHIPTQTGKSTSQCLAEL